MNTKETQITPGYWEVAKHGTPEAFPQFGIYAEGAQNDHVIVKGDTWDQAKANARIIALAPELCEFADQVARSACLDQRVGGKCICFSCEAKRLLDLLQ